MTATWVRFVVKAKTTSALTIIQTQCETNVLVKLN